MTSKLNTLIFLILILCSTNCKDNNIANATPSAPNSSTDKITMAKEIGVYDVLSDPAYIKQVKALDLKCPNLLDPRLSNEDADILIAAWRDLNQKIGSQLVSSDFNWNTNSETVKIFHKFYFNKDGSIMNYYYNIMDTTISKATRKAYGNSVKSIINEHRINISKDSAFAQCGRMEFKAI